jgi:hypothetical protein
MINEALLEMRYFKPLVDHFSALYGGNFLTLLKPSPQNEAWVGFDQGWARTTLTSSSLLQELRRSVQNNATVTRDFFFGYFLQFKVVDRMVRRSKVIPDNYVTPYLRAVLSLEPNPTTGLSQHETLLRLSNIVNASVYYACPMLFEIADIWRDASIDDIRLVSIRTSPPGWATNTKHYIMFQDENDTWPIWKSESIKTRAVTVEEWSSLADTESAPHMLAGNQLADLIESTLSTILESDGRRLHLAFREHKDPYTQLIPPAFTIMQFRPPENRMRRILNRRPIQNR